MIRLTGRHPFNAEPPLSVLMSAGMITPPAIHFVRNRGAVPPLSWDTHTVTVSGLVAQPLTLTMDELAAMPAVSIPVTLTAADNRRKELSTLKPTAGFASGPAATACSVWTGARLRDVLLRAGVAPDADHSGRFVCLEGADALPPDGPTGTAIPLAHAMDPTMDVLLAVEHNGQRLLPDHGAPVRAVVPGWVEGRSVKWLARIAVTDRDSDNPCHRADNRILPPQVRGRGHGGRTPRSLRRSFGGV